MFTACHPVLSTEARVALTLRLLGGLTTDEIARAFLVPEPTIAQRIVRAKRTLAEAQVPFEVPRGAELAARLASVLEVIYLIFNEGYSATAGDDWMRPALCEDALRLGRILAELAPRRARGARPGGADGDPGLARARRASAPTGEPILLLEQNRARWDQLLIRRGLAALARAEALGGARGPYALQAAIAACHARARTRRRRPTGRASPRSTTRWPQLTPSPVVELNRAVAVGDGVRARPRASRSSTRSPTSRRCASYHLLPSVRGDLLAKLGRFDEARGEFERAASLTRNARERALLGARRGLRSTAAERLGGSDSCPGDRGACGCAPPRPACARARSRGRTPRAPRRRGRAAAAARPAGRRSESIRRAAAPAARSSPAPPPAPRTLETATARLSVTTGEGVRRSSVA